MQINAMFTQVSGFAFVFWGIASLTSYIVLQFIPGHESLFHEYFAFQGAENIL